MNTRVLRQNAGIGDMSNVYDESNALLSQYVQRRQEQALQTEQEPDYTTFSDTGEGEPEQENIDPVEDFTIPDAEYYSRLSFDINGEGEDTADRLSEMQDKMDGMQQQMALYELMGAYNIPMDDAEDSSSTPNAESQETYNPIVEGQFQDISFDEGDPKASISVRHNNPGNMEYSDFTAKFGAKPGTKRSNGRSYANFPDIESGLKAQGALLRTKGYSTRTVREAMNRWITGDPAQEGAYSKKLADAFQNRKMSELSDAELRSLQLSQIRYEDVDLARKMGLIKQSGGSVNAALTPIDKYIGLNNNELDDLLIQNNGMNQYRGLDNQQPVLLQDELGSNQLLLGPEDQSSLFGNVYENRL
jgi:hypothetical protein